MREGQQQPVGAEASDRGIHLSVAAKVADEFPLVTTVVGGVGQHPFRLVRVARVLGALDGPRVGRSDSQDRVQSSRSGLPEMSLAENRVGVLWRNIREGSRKPLGPALAAVGAFPEHVATLWGVFRDADHQRTICQFQHVPGCQHCGAFSERCGLQEQAGPCAAAVGRAVQITLGVALLVADVL